LSNGVNNERILVTQATEGLSLKKATQDDDGGTVGRTDSDVTHDAEVQAAADGQRHLLLTVEQLRPRYGALAGVGDTDLMALGNLVARGPMSAAELARRLGITRSSVTTLVDRLEAADLVAREPDAQDRRRLRLVVTEQGENAARKVRALTLDALQHVPSEHLPTVARALDELAAALDHLESTTAITDRA
jgi:DNA-binding MarR family transcriptional regulator